MPGKTNDWLVAGINNPSMSNDDFASVADMTVDNTQFLSMDDYLKSNFIQNNDLFKDDRGNFSEELFAQYYAKRASDWQDFTTQDYYRGPALDMFSTFRKPDTPVQDIHFSIRRGVNPDRQAIGIEGPNIWSDPVYSQRELAKQNKVYNTEKGEFEDFSVNDHTLVSNVGEWLKDLFKEPLVMAAWDEDGTHIDPVTGLETEHKRGDLKLNDRGTYYYETLGGRSVLGKDVLSVFDTFTVDGQGLNKYDFFDSNDIHKSVGGTIAKTVATVLPLFCGPAVGYVYAGLQISRGMLESVPMLYGMVTALSHSDTPQWVSNLASVGARTKMSTSDYAKQHVFAFENFGNLVADVAVQWGQQRAIAEAFGLLRGTRGMVSRAQKQADALFAAKKAQFVGKEDILRKVCYDRFVAPAQRLAQEAGGLGRDVSLAYMAIISNSDVYEDMQERGASKFEAAAVALGSTLGMFAVDKWAHLGELFFDEATPDTIKQARATLRNEFKNAQTAIDAIAKSNTPQQPKTVSLIRKGIDAGRRAFSKFNEDLRYHTTGFFGKALGEGLEEVSEEVMADMAKTIYQVAGQFGLNTSVANVGAWDNAFERYAMNFLGGAVGGSVFYGKSLWDGKTFHRPKLDEDIATLIRNGHADDLRAQLDRMNNEGLTGSKTLSATNPVRGSDNTMVFNTTDDESQSQSAAITSMVRAKINAIEGTLLANRNANMSDDELFENMVLSEERYLRYVSIAPVTNLYQDYTTAVNNLVQADQNYMMALNTVDGTVNGPQFTNDKNEHALTQEAQEERSKNLQKLDAERTKAKDAVDRFVSGNEALEFMQKLNFIMDPLLHRPFMNIDQQSVFTKLHPRKKFNQLSEDEQNKFMLVEYPRYVQENLKTLLPPAWEAFKQMESVMAPVLGTLEEYSYDYKRWVEDIHNLFESKVLDLQTLIDSHKQFDDKLDSETQEEYDNRDRAMMKADGTMETNDEFIKRHNDRIRSIDAYNDQQDELFADRIRAELEKVNMQVDATTARYIMSVVSGRGPFQANVMNKDGKVEKQLQYSPGQWGRLRAVIQRKIELSDLSPAIKSVLGMLDPDLSNTEEVRQVVRDMFFKKAVSPYKNTVSPIFNLTLKRVNGETVTLSELLSEESNDYIASDWSIQDLFNAFAAFRNGISSGGGTLFSNDDIKLFENAELDDDSLVLLEQAFADFNTASAGMKTAGDLNALDLASGIVDESVIAPDVKNAIGIEVTATMNTVDTVLRSIQDNPLFKLQHDLKTYITNPVAVLVRRMAEANGDILPDIEKLLRKLQDDYANIDDVSELILDDTTEATLKKASDYMQLMKVYLYAAAKVPNTEVPIGHNKIINSYAELHKDRLVEEWNPLPELDADYMAMYQTTIDEYCKEIDDWIRLSQGNRANQVAKFVAVDKIFNTTMWNVLSSIQPEFKINGHTYRLLEGIDEIDTSQLGSDYAQIPLFNLECRFYDNIQDIAKKEGLTVEQLVYDHGLLEALLPDLTGISDQRCSEITSNMTADEVTDYTKFIYFTTLLSIDPREYYKQLKSIIDEDKELIPSVAQEYCARVGQASMNPVFNNIFEYGMKKARPEAAIASHFTLINGVAGAGKTRAVAGFINRLVKDKPVLVAAPTDVQAQKLRDALGRRSCGTKEELMETLLGTDQWTEIKKALEGIKESDKPVKTAWFEIVTGKDGLRKLTLNPDSVTFRTLAETPAAIFFDEATHLSSLEAQIAALYCKKTGIQFIALGDTSQSGHIHQGSKVTNIDEASITCIRTPKLSVSLRSNNLQKSTNDTNVKTQLDIVKDLRLHAEESDYHAYLPKAVNLMSKLNFRVYDKEDINGDLITRSLDNHILSRLAALQKRGKTVAFIGNSSSVYLTQMKDAGINPTVLTFNEMQSQEFDYVVIDHQWLPPKDMFSVFTTLQDLYSLMTRATTGSIIIDNGLSRIIGNNIESDTKAMAPSISVEVRNSLRTRKRNTLALLNLDKAQSAVTPQTVTPPTPPAPAPPAPPTPPTPPAPAPPAPPTPPTPPAPPIPPSTPGPAAGTTGGTAPTAHVDPNAVPPTTSNGGFNTADPDAKDSATRAADKNVLKIINTQALQDADGNDDGLPINTSDAISVGDLSAFPVECYSDFTTLSVDVTDNQEFTGNDGKVRRAQRWTVRVPQNGNILRNLQALCNDGETAITYKEKLSLQDRVNIVKSALEYGHTWEELPEEIRNKFDKGAWEKGVFRFEIRKATETDVPPIGSPAVTTDPDTGRRVATVGMNFEGTELMANIVFEVVNKAGQVCRIDLAAVNNPEVLLDNSGQIRSNLEAKRNKLQNRLNKSTAKRDAAIRTQLEADIAKLDGMISSLPTVSQQYREWFRAQVQQFNQSGKDSYDFELLNDDFSFSQTTWFRRRLEPIRLGGRINPNNITENDVKDLMDLNSNMVFSKIYTFTDKDVDEFKLVDQSLKGKAVVFVTSDKLFKGQGTHALLEEYLAQKANPTVKTPRVRMLVLGNYGMSFADMCDLNYLATLQDGSTAEPFKQNFNGVRMFVSLWNARAALYRFINELSAWSASVFGSSDDTAVQKLHKLLEIQTILFRNPGTDVSSMLEANGLTADMLDALDRFNNVICNEKGITMFRIGHSENNHGFHVQKYTTSWKDADGNIHYNSEYGTAENPVESANMLSITLEQAQKFQVMLDAVLSAIVPVQNAGETNGTGHFSLNAVWTEYDKEKGFTATAFPNEKERYIDYENAKVRRTLSGMLDRNLGNVRITIPGDAESTIVRYANGDTWSAIPTLLRQIVRSVNYLQMHPEKVIGPQSLYTNFSYGGEYDSNGKRTGGKTIQIELGEIMGELRPVSYTSPSGESQILPDYDLSYMFDLIFHGTIEDFHQGGKLQLTDAYFKNGFYINPDVVRVKNRIVGHIAKMVGGEDIMDFYEIGTTPALFLSDVDIRSAGIRLNLANLMRSAEERAKVSSGQPAADTASAELEFAQNHPVEYKIMQSMKKSGIPVEYTDDGMIDAINKYNDKQEQQFWDKLSDGKPADAMKRKMVVNGVETEVYRKVLINLGHPNAKVAVSDTDLMVTDSDGSVYRFNGANMSLVKLSGPAQVTPATPTRFGGKWKNTGLSPYDALINLLLEGGQVELIRALVGIYNARNTLSDKEICDLLNDIKVKYQTQLANLVFKKDKDLYNKIFNSCS